MSGTTKQKKQLRVAEASASYLVEPKQVRHSGESRNPVPLARLAEVAEINPRRFSTQPDDDELVSFIPMKAVEEETGRLDASQIRPWREVKKGYTPFQDGDVIFAKITPCMENGKFALAKGLHDGRAAGSTEFHVFRPGPTVDSEYLLHFLFTPELRSNAKLKMQGAAGQLRVTTNFFNDVEIPLPPINDQRQIVAEIEKQFTRLEAGIVALRRVQANLKRYRAAVLKAACEGHLVPTEAELARKERRTYESADKLLLCVLNERRTKWTGRGKYKEPAAVDNTNLPALPDGWTWATVEQLAAPEPNSITDGPFGSNLKTDHYTDSGPRVIRLQNIGDGIYVDEEAHISEAHFQQLQKHCVFANDLVIAGFGDNPPRSCIIPATLGPAIVKADCIRFKPNNGVAVKYLNAALNSEPVRKRTKGMVHGVGRPRLNLGEIKSVVLPIPPLAEQRRIVAEVERRLSVIEEQDAVVTANLQRATRLRQSILANAFNCENEINGALE